MNLQCALGAEFEVAQMTLYFLWKECYPVCAETCNCRKYETRLLWIAVLKLPKRPYSSGSKRHLVIYTV